MSNPFPPQGYPPDQPAYQPEGDPTYQPQGEPGYQPQGTPGYQPQNPGYQDQYQAQPGQQAYPNQPHQGYQGQDAPAYTGERYLQAEVPTDLVGSDQRPPAMSERLPQDDRSIGDIMGDLTANVSTLMRQEVALAKAEVTQSATRAGKGAGMFAGAGVAGHFVLLFLSLALWWGLGHLISSTDVPSLGISGLIVAVIWAVVAGVLFAMGKTNFKKVEGVEHTQQTLSQIPNAFKGNEEKNR